MVVDLRIWKTRGLGLSGLATGHRGMKLGRWLRGTRFGRRGIVRILRTVGAIIEWILGDMSKEVM